METKAKRFGFFDGLILLLILLGILGIAARVLLWRRTEAGDRQARTVLLTAQAIHARSLDCIEVGEVLYFADGSAFGLIESVEATPAKIELAGDRGVIFGAWKREERVDLSLSVRVDLSLSVRVQGWVHEGDFLHDVGRALLIGERMTLYGQRSAFSFVIVGYQNI